MDQRSTTFCSETHWYNNYTAEPLLVVHDNSFKKQSMIVAILSFHEPQQSALPCPLGMNIRNLHSIDEYCSNPKITVD